MLALGHAPHAAHTHLHTPPHPHSPPPTRTHTHFWTQAGTRRRLQQSARVLFPLCGLCYGFLPPSYFTSLPASTPAQPLSCSFPQRAQRSAVGPPASSLCFLHCCLLLLYPPQSIRNAMASYHLVLLVTTQCKPSALHGRRPPVPGLSRSSQAQTLVPVPDSKPPQLQPTLLYPSPPANVTTLPSIDR